MPFGTEAEVSPQNSIVCQWFVAALKAVHACKGTFLAVTTPVRKRLHACDESIAEVSGWRTGLDARVSATRVVYGG